MSKSRDALGVVLAGLRERLAAGAIAPGAAISISDTASRFRVSVTPVREALARLVGEGVLKSTRRSGYERAALRADELRQLYAFREQLLLAAARLGSVGCDMEPARATGEGDAAKLFEALVASAENVPLARAYAVTALLIAPAAAVEPSLLDDLAREDAELRAAFAAADVVRFEESLRAYHGRRMQIAARLAERLLSGTPIDAP